VISHAGNLRGQFVGLCFEISQVFQFHVAVNTANIQGRARKSINVSRNISGHVINQRCEQVNLKLCQK
jgi:hypothetical protein